MVCSVYAQHSRRQVPNSKQTRSQRGRLTNALGRCIHLSTECRLENILDPIHGCYNADHEKPFGQNMRGYCVRLLSCYLPSASIIPGQTSGDKLWGCDVRRQFRIVSPVTKNWPPIRPHIEIHPHLPHSGSGSGSSTPFHVIIATCNVSQHGPYAFHNIRNLHSGTDPSSTGSRALSSKWHTRHANPL